MIDNETKISSNVVVDELRLNFLPHYFVAQFLQGEALIYDWATRLSSDYEGGMWHFFQLSNGSFYVAPAHSGQVHVQWHLNGFDDTMGADAFGIVVTLFALCHLAERGGDDKIIDHYHALRAFASQHDEVAKILSAID